jgi:hypothetical protein
MRNTTTELHRTKLILSCVLFVSVGGVLIAIGRQVGNNAGWTSWVPWSELGGVLVGAGILSVGLDAYLRREQEAIDELRLKQLFTDQAPAMRDAVLEAFAANHDDLKRIATPEMLDQLISNSLALRLHDEQFAHEVYTDIRDQAVSAKERWYDASLSIDLAPHPMGRGSAKSTGSRSRHTRLYFSVTVRWEYTTTPAHAHRRFVCLSDRDEYAELLQDSDATSAWFINPASDVDPMAPESFELLRFTVDGEERPIRRTTRKAAQIYTASLGAEALRAEKPVTVAYTYRTLMAQDGNFLFFDIEQPTRDLNVTFDYSGCGIANVSTLDLVPSVRPTRIEAPPDAGADETVRVDIDGWIFPRSGVAFVWTLEREVVPRPVRSATLSPNR